MVDRPNPEDGFSADERQAYEGQLETAQLETSTPASEAFAAAFDSPDEFDFGMESERLETGLANFGFDPEMAAQLREEECARMAEAQVPVLAIGLPLVHSGHEFTVTAIHKRGVDIANTDRELTLTHGQVYTAMKQMQEAAQATS